MKSLTALASFTLVSLFALLSLLTLLSSLKPLTFILPLVFHSSPPAAQPRLRPPLSFPCGAAAILFPSALPPLSKWPFSPLILIVFRRNLAIFRRNVVTWGGRRQVEGGRWPLRGGRCSRNGGAAWSSQFFSLILRAASPSFPAQPYGKKQAVRRSLIAETIRTALLTLS